MPSPVSPLGIRLGRSAENALPRYRTRRAMPDGSHRYVFAARLRRAPGYWFVIGSTAWTVLDDETMQTTYAPSNAEARKLRKEPAA